MDAEQNHSLKKYLSPLNVWALSFGCAVGWGAFAMPGTTFLPLAGPWGTALGMGIGGIVMLIIGFNYFYMMNKFPDAGGTYTYAKKNSRLRSRVYGLVVFNFGLYRDYVGEYDCPADDFQKFNRRFFSVRFSLSSCRI